MYYVKQKYTNARKQTYNGFQYDSNFEASIAFELDMKLRAGEILDYEKQKNIELIVNDFIVCTYRIDFVVYHKDGTTEFIEAKGWQSDVWKLKWKLFEAIFSNNPNNILTIIQQGKFKRPKLRKIKKFGYICLILSIAIS